MAKEQDYQRRIMDTLKSRYSYTVKVITASKKGVPDILACMPITKEQAMKHFETHDTLGVFVAVEVKTPTTMNTASKLQEFNIKVIQESGGIAMVAWSDLALLDKLEEHFGE